MTTSSDPLTEAFRKLSVQRASQFHASGARLVHYTSADTAMRIIQGSCNPDPTGSFLWLRNTRLMNDTQEIAHGLSMIRQTFVTREAKQFFDMIDGLHSKLGSYLRTTLQNHLVTSMDKVFVCSLSEHLRRDDILGRLSMWRAYGSENGVGLVFKDSLLKAVESEERPDGIEVRKVFYTGPRRSATHFAQVFDAFHNNIGFLRTLSRHEVAKRVRLIFRQEVAGLKHPGFSEEREWRLVHDESLWSNRALALEEQVLSVGGVPQRIKKLALKDFGPGQTDLSLASVLDRIIIGPSAYATELKKTFTELLSSAESFKHPVPIVISGIPLRK